MSPLDERPDPDALLAQLRRQDEAQSRGRLRIYFGASAGVGKTCAMLQAAQRLAAQGNPPLVGVVETHGRADTAALVEGLPRLPLKSLSHRGRPLPEFDLDAALARLKGQPGALILVDELAHANVAGSRHPKRWQDVEELLANGIHVYTTLNVQHLESLNEVVGGITGVRVQETLPDTFFDRADEVVLVDTPADELLARLKAGKVYPGPQAERASQHFFRKGNLMALRELALRRTADRVEDDVQAWRSNERITPVWKTEAAILCAIGPGEEAEAVVRSAAQLAQQLAVSWQAVFVETPALHRRPDDRRERQLRVVRLAQDLGAQASVLAGQDVAQALAQHARSHNLSKLVLGRGGRRAGHGFAAGWLRPTLAQRLARLAPELDLIQVSAQPALPGAQPGSGGSSGSSGSGGSGGSGAPNRLGEPGLAAAGLRPWRRYGAAVLACLGVAALCWPLARLVANDNLVMLFLLGVVGVALRLGRGPAVLASFLSVGLFDFLFVAPHFSFAVSDVQYLITFAVMLAVGLVTGQLTAGLRYEAQVSAEREARARGLFELTRALAGALQTEQVLATAAPLLSQQMGGAPVHLFWLDGRDQLRADQGASPSGEPATQADLPGSLPSPLPDGLDPGAARWALDHEQAAGQGTDTLPGSAWFYLPLRAPMRVRGVLALRPPPGWSLMLPERRAQLDTAGRIVAQALERVHYVEVAQQALLQIESERLRNSLLSALSHDVRTPLAALQGLAETLAARPGLDAAAQELTQALQEQARRLQAMVHKLLDMARLQSGSLRLNKQWQPVEEVVGSALASLGGALQRHALALDFPPDLPLVALDATLLERVLANLLENAAKYTPPGSQLRLGARVQRGDTAQGDALWITLEDNGPGLPAGREEALFEKFSRGQHESDLPGMGLGLAICRAIMHAHGGRIWAERVSPAGGARFCLSLPLGQAPALPDEDMDDPSTGAMARE
jgi:two-component system sensor histidine kinase KdpD